MKKVFYNPKIKDKVTVLRSAEDTNNEYILVEVELAPGGGNDRHYHTTFDETFMPVQGVLGVEVEKTQLLLQGNATATAYKNEVHRFYNPGNETIRFRVKIFPAQPRFLESLCIGYGLADDGKTNSKGIPKKLDHLAVLLEHADTRLTGFYALIESWLLRRARRARKKGVLNQLLEQYCE